MKILLQQDECAPDSLEYFKKEMKEKYNLTFDLFIEQGNLTDNGYQYKGYLLEYKDEPYWTLSLVFTHNQYSKFKLISWGQYLFTKERYATASDVMNLLGYWGEKYAEDIFNRLYNQIPEEYLQMNEDERELEHI